MYIHKVIIYMAGVLVWTMRMMHLGVEPDTASEVVPAGTPPKSRISLLCTTFLIFAIAVINLWWVVILTGNLDSTAWGVHRSLTGGTLHITRSMSFAQDNLVLHGHIFPSHKTPSGISYNPMSTSGQFHSTVVSPYTFEVFNETSDDEDQMTAHQRMMQANARTVMMCDLKTPRTVCDYTGEGKFGTCTADTDFTVTAMPSENTGNKGNYLQICGIKCGDEEIDKCCDALQGLTKTEVECCQPDFYGHVAVEDQTHKTGGKYSIQWKSDQYVWTNTREEEVCKLTHHSDLVVARNVSPRGFAKNHSENLLYATILILFNFWVFNVGNRYLNRHTMTEQESGMLKVGSVLWFICVGFSIVLVLDARNDGHVDVMKLEDDLLTREYANGTYAYFCLCIFLVVVYNALIICFSWARVAQIIYDDAKNGFAFGSEKVKNAYDQTFKKGDETSGKYQTLENKMRSEAEADLVYAAKSNINWKVGSFGVRDKHKVVVHEFGGPLTGGGYRPAYSDLAKIDTRVVNEGIPDRDALCEYMEWDTDSFYITLILPAIALVGVVTRHVYTLDVNVAAVTWGLLGLGVLLTLFSQFTKICAVTELIGVDSRPTPTTPSDKDESKVSMRRFFTLPFSVIGILGVVVYFVVGIGYSWAINIIQRGMHDEHEVMDMDISFGEMAGDPKISYAVWIWIAYVFQLLMYGKTALFAYQLLSPDKATKWKDKLLSGRGFRNVLVTLFIFFIWIVTFVLVHKGFEKGKEKYDKKMLRGHCAYTEEGVFPASPRHYFERKNCVWTGGLHEYNIRA